MKAIKTEKLLPLITPGEILREEFLLPLQLTEYRLAKEIGVPARRINEIVKGQRRITADTARRFALFFGMTPHFSAQSPDRLRITPTGTRGISSPDYAFRENEGRRVAIKPHP
ncbi:MAG: HigA family addiction module antitoxin [Chthoniobacteraceae bacterium]